MVIVLVTVLSPLPKAPSPLTSAALRDRKATRAWPRPLPSVGPYQLGTRGVNIGPAWGTGFGKLPFGQLQKKTFVVRHSFERYFPK